VFLLRNTPSVWLCKLSYFGCLKVSGAATDAALKSRRQCSGNVSTARVLKTHQQVGVATAPLPQCMPTVVLCTRMLRCTSRINRTAEAKVEEARGSRRKDTESTNQLSASMGNRTTRHNYTHWYDRVHVGASSVQCFSLHRMLLSHIRQRPSGR